MNIKKKPALFLRRGFGLVEEVFLISGSGAARAAERAAFCGCGGEAAVLAFGSAERKARRAPCEFSPTYPEAGGKQ